MDNVIREQAIRERAYTIWEEQGRPDGRDREHWFRAESEINSTTGPHDKPSAAPMDQTRQER